jgi:hypothetical protein
MGFDTARARTSAGERRTNTAVGPDGNGLAVCRLGALVDAERSGKLM